MKVILCAIPLMLSFAIFSAQAAEKMDPTSPAKPAAPAGKDGSWSGQLANTQGAGIAVLKVKEDKKELTLYADTDSVKKDIADALKKKANVTVNGMMAPDNVSVKVTSVTVDEKKKRGKNGSGN